ncbi:MAG: class I SAM-dependent methyltransferase [Xanthobacteraceae bacterium]
MAIESCNGCGLIVQNPQPSDPQLAAIYGSNYFIGSSENDRLGSQFDLVKRATASLQLDEIGAYLTKRGQAVNRLSLLEVGCGHGNMLLEASNKGYQVHGLEYSVDAARVANDKLGADVVRVGAITEDTFPEESFDVCILADVIEHVRDPAGFIQDIRRILKPGGVLFIATPSTASWSARLLGRHWMEYKPEHLFYFDRSTLARLLSNAGFDHIKISGGRKVLTADYVIGHFDKFPVPVISPLLNALRAVAPTALLGKPVRITASGMNVLAVKEAA